MAQIPVPCGQMSTNRLFAVFASMIGGHAQKCPSRAAVESSCDSVVIPAVERGGGLSAPPIPIAC